VPAACDFASLRALVVALSWAARSFTRISESFQAPVIREIKSEKHETNWPRRLISGTVYLLQRSSASMWYSMHRITNSMHSWTTSCKQEKEKARFQMDSQRNKISRLQGNIRGGFCFSVSPFLNLTQTRTHQGMRCPS
jgi:hypothetical protein